MKCKVCGCEDFEEKWMNFPIMWGPEIGVIKSDPQSYYVCKKCGTPYSPEENIE